MKTFATLAGAIILGVASITTATADAGSVSRVVKYGDLDLNSPEGAKTLYKRISIAAESLCDRLESRVLTQHRVFMRCVRESVNRAVADVDRPALTQYASTRGYVPAPDPTVASSN